jgi:hypothetical protein
MYAQGTEETPRDVEMCSRRLNGFGWMGFLSEVVKYVSISGGPTKRGRQMKH